MVSRLERDRDRPDRDQHGAGPRPGVAARQDEKTGTCDIAWRTALDVTLGAQTERVFDRDRVDFGGAAQGPCRTFRRALAEIARVAGSVDDVFLVTVQPWTLTARLGPGAVWRGSTEVHGDQAMVSMRPVTLGEKLAATALLGLTAAIAFWPKGQARRGRLA